MRDTTARVTPLPPPSPPIDENTSSVPASALGAIERAVFRVIHREHHSVTSALILKRLAVNDSLITPGVQVDAAALKTTLQNLQLKGDIKEVNKAEGQAREWVAVKRSATSRRRLENYLAGVILPGDTTLTTFDDQPAKYFALKWTVGVLGLAEFALHIILLVLTIYRWRDHYNWLAFTIPYAFCFFTLAKAGFARRRWAPEEFDVRNMLLGLAARPSMAVGSVTGASGTDGKRLLGSNPPFISKWLGTTYLVFILQGICFIRTASLFAQVDVHGAGPVCKSSCRRSLGEDGQLYNPGGFFPYGSIALYDEEFATGYTPCVLHGRWAGSESAVTHIGQNITELNTPGVLYMKAGESQTMYYPNPAYGAPEMVNSASLKETDLMGLCSGVVEDVARDQDLIDCGVDIPVDNAAGRGRKVCPVCLGYWRDQMGIQGSSDPVGYSHCDTDSGQGRTPLCYFCPGLGQGWLAANMGWESELPASLIAGGGTEFLDEQYLEVNGLGGRITFASLKRTIEEEYACYLGVLLFPWLRWFILVMVSMSFDKNTEDEKDD